MTTGAAVNSALSGCSIAVLPPGPPRRIRAVGPFRADSVPLGPSLPVAAAVSGNPLHERSDLLASAHGCGVGRLVYGSTPPTRSRKTCAVRPPTGQNTRQTMLVVKAAVSLASMRTACRFRVGPGEHGNVRRLGHDQRCLPPHRACEAGRVGKSSNQHRYPAHLPGGSAVSAARPPPACRFRKSRRSTPLYLRPRCGQRPAR